MTPSSLRGLTVIEITENSVIDDFDRMRDIVRKLRAHGFRVAIDDAGAGYAGLQTMVEIEPDFIKLDMSLIRGVDIVDRQAAIGPHVARLLPPGRHHAHRRGHRDAQAARHPVPARRLARPRIPLRPARIGPAPARGLSAARGCHAQVTVVLPPPHPCDSMPRTMTTHDMSRRRTLRDGAAQPHRPSIAAAAPPAPLGVAGPGAPSAPLL